MRKVITLLASAAIALSGTAQTIEISTQYGNAYGSGVEVDVNNNGHLDLLFGGLGRKTQFVEDADGNEVETEKVNWLLVFNPDTKKFEEKTFPYLCADRPNFLVADFNGDGDMDLLLIEHQRGALSQRGIFLGNGDGTFEPVEMTFDDPTYKFNGVTAAVADFNNDGLIDIVTIGYEKIDDVLYNYSAVLMNKGNYHFEVTNTELLYDYELALAVVKVLDHNNDGYMDFIVSANSDNANNNARVITDIFENLGAEEPGAFFRLYLGDGMIFQKGNGGLDIADFNGDGWLDFAIHGEGGEGTGEPTGGDVWQCISHVYINQKNGSYADKAQPAFSNDLRPLNSTGTSTRVIDWNNDGFPDIFIPGWNPAPETVTQAGFYWLNDGTGTFGNKTRVPGASEAYILFPDWNGDGVRDYMMMGQSWDAEYFTDENNARTSAVLLNGAKANQRPTAPKNLTAAVDDNKVTLSWEAGADAETPATGLSYEYYLKRNGKLYSSCRSHVGGSLDGVRKVLDLGNAMMNKKISLQNLPGGDYEWGVQAIDASYEGSTFATGTFKIAGSSIEEAGANKAYDLYANDGSLFFQADAAASVEVYNTLGVKMDAKQHCTSFNTSLPKGIYVVKVVIGNKSESKSIIIK
ncbi:T9SS type A sorting domain-containing protein [Parabacteroides sp. OttesenSCG-928-N08]|nr:T9SS type A sorting domain-containing protein [Parabacteroides sp. OttesenSCG-928-N08]